MFNLFSEEAIENGISRLKEDISRGIDTPPQISTVIIGRKSEQ